MNHFVYDFVENISFEKSLKMKFHGFENAIRLNET